MFLLFGGAAHLFFRSVKSVPFIHQWKCDCLLAVNVDPVQLRPKIKHQIRRLGTGFWPGNGFLAPVCGSVGIVRVWPSLDLICNRRQPRDEQNSRLETLPGEAIQSSSSLVLTIFYLLVLLLGANLLSFCLDVLGFISESVVNSATTLSFRRAVPRPEA